nr:MAG: hypothetical protein J07AB56_01780 [Candidatus Nanosalinarum sp. J07AB56]
MSDPTRFEERTVSDLEESEYQTREIQYSLEEGDPNKQVLEKFLGAENIEELEGKLEAYAAGMPVTGAFEYELTADGSTYEGRVTRADNPSVYGTLDVAFRGRL